MRIDDDEMIEFQTQLGVVAAGGEAAAALIRGDDGMPFDEWISNPEDTEEFEMRALAAQNHDFLKVVIGFAGPDIQDQKLQHNALWLLNVLCLALGKSSPEEVSDLARLQLRSRNFRNRMHAASIIRSIEDKLIFDHATRILVDILVNEEFDRWEAVEAAAEVFRRFGAPRWVEQDRLQSLIDDWKRRPMRGRTPEAHQFGWSLAAGAASYLGLRKEDGTGPWWNYERDCVTRNER